jgi:hypothetical protein
MDRLRGMIAGSGDKEEVEEDEVNALMPEGDHSDKKSRKQKEKNTLRKALFVGAAEYGAQLVEQVIRASGVEGNTPLSQVQVHGVSSLKSLMQMVHPSSQHYCGNLKKQMQSSKNVPPRQISKATSPQHHKKTPKS